MVYYAVIDTNVFISALLSKRADAATVRVLESMFDGKIVPLYHNDILAEYDEVLHRSKFHFKEETIQLVINAVKQYGVEVFPQPTGEILIDMDDLVFYEVAMEKRNDDAYSTFKALVLIKLAYKEGLIERATYLKVMEKYGRKYGWKNGNG